MPISSLQALSILEIKPGSDSSEPGYSMEPDDGSKSLQWWTLSQRIGTLTEIPLEVTLLATAEPPKYEQIADKALRLKQLGLAYEAIAQQLGVGGKTVAKALRWIEA